MQIDTTDTVPARRGPGRPPNGDSVATKLRILDAAIDSFGRGGFADTPSQTIAQLAGVTPATVYHHFVNKRQLYVAAFQRSVDIAWKAYGEAAAEAGGSLVDELAAIVETALAIMERRPAMTLLALRAALDVERGVLDRTLPDDVLAAITRRAVERGELVEGDGVHIRFVTETLLWGISAVGSRGDQSARQRCGEAVEFVLQGGLLRGTRAASART